MTRILPIIILLLALAAGIGLGYRFAAGRRDEARPRAVLAVLDPRIGGGVYAGCDDGQHFLVDPGPAADAEQLVSWLRESGIEDVTLILTNPTARRTGAVDTIAKSVRVRRILRAQTGNDDEWASQLSAARQRKVPEIGLKGGDRVILTKSTSLHVFSPPEEPLKATSDVTEENSLIVQMVMGRTRFLLMSDAGAIAESYLMRSGAYLMSNVLVIGRYGALGATSLELLAAVRPQDIVVPGSSAAPNADRTVLRRIGPAATGAELHRADMNGTVQFATDGFSVRSISGH